MKLPRCYRAVDVSVRDNAVFFVTILITICWKVALGSDDCWSKVHSIMFKEPILVSGFWWLSGQNYNKNAVVNISLVNISA